MLIKSIKTTSTRYRTTSLMNSCRQFVPTHIFPPLLLIPPTANQTLSFAYSSLSHTLFVSLLACFFFSFPAQGLLSLWPFILYSFTSANLKQRRFKFFLASSQICSSPPPQRFVQKHFDSQMRTRHLKMTDNIQRCPLMLRNFWSPH